MYESMRVLSPLMFIYYIAFYIIVVIIILNLFLAVILDAYNVQESSQQKVKFEFKTEESKGSQEHKEVVTVSKANVKWKRELLRGDLPELANKELLELNKDSQVDLLKLMKEKEDKKDEKKESAALSQLHATLYGATFVAKITKAIADNKEKDKKLRNSENNTVTPTELSSSDGNTATNKPESLNSSNETVKITEKQPDVVTNTEPQITDSQKPKEPSKFALRIRNAMNKNKISTESTDTDSKSQDLSEKKES